MIKIITTKKLNMLLTKAYDRGAEDATERCIGQIERRKADIAADRVKSYNEGYARGEEDMRKLFKHTKVCRKCGRRLPLDKYAKNNFSPDGHRSWCKECYNKKRKEEQK